MLIALQYAQLLLVVIITSVIVVVIARRVIEGREGILQHLLDGSSGELGAQLLQILRIGREGQLLVGGEAVQTHILQLAVVGIEGIAGALRARHLTPDGRINLGEVAIHRQPVLKELLLIFQDVLGDLTQVEIEVASLCGRLVDVGIHQPELDILIVGRL